MMLANLACTSAIAALFLRWTRYTVRGDYWHAVSQIVSEDTRLILDEATEKSDKDVTRMLGDQRDVRVRIRPSYGEKGTRSRVQLVAVDGWMDG